MNATARILFVALAIICVPSAAETIRLESPSGELAGEFTLTDGIPFWSIQANDTAVLEKGRLGVKLTDQAFGSFDSVSVEMGSANETVKTTWGNFAEYADHCRSLTWTLVENDAPRRTLRIEARAYDQALAVRYVFPKEGGYDERISLSDDQTEFVFPRDATSWCYAGEHDPEGPKPLSKFRAKKGTAAQLPFVSELGPNLFTAIMEAAIYDVAPMDLVSSNEGEYALRGTFSKSTIETGAATSWRVVQVASTPGDLLLSPVTYCLNPPCQLEDPSWVKPGLAMWDWRAWGAQTDDGFTYGLDMPSWRRFIDFASKHGVAYLVLDAGWYGLEFEASSDPTTSRDYLLVQPDPNKPHLKPQAPPSDWADPTDIPELIQYARDRDVGIILYINDIARLNFPFDETLALYEKWGAAGIKYGFMKGKGQQKVLDTCSIVEQCAKHHLLCDFHDGPIPPSGDRRTYPNYVAREFCHAQSDSLRTFTPTGFCETVFVNMLAGPLDMNNGLFTLEDPASVRPKIFKNVDTTVVAETARVMITFSGLAILPDCPEAYEAKSDLFEFLGKLPMTWNETRVLDGKIGHYISMARRSGGEWFIASANNEEPRTLQIKLDFLDPNVQYVATLFEDGADAHYQTNRESYRVRKIEVKQGDVISANMAAGGGHCVLISQK
ncbi:alpha-glucosidase [Rhodopirellula rubra]|uniref:Alpha-glucosidase n=1 Tax=Aporhodopirellula rubra TaxID=980271 RepID=A0A7W5DYB6_9BACT|nr:glycoside hydrolase family 97 protein [Aporhodopirellula rubra]MBB3205847.1 alpha-glucosidase [Aporhodopirellula rubra]